MKYSKLLIMAFLGLSLSFSAYCSDELDPRPSKKQAIQLKEGELPVPVAAGAHNPDPFCFLESNAVRTVLRHWFAYSLTDDSILAPLACTSNSARALVQFVRQQRQNAGAAREFLYFNLDRLNSDMAIVRDLQYGRSPLRYVDLVVNAVGSISIFERLESFIASNGENGRQCGLDNLFLYLFPLLTQADAHYPPSNIDSLLLLTPNSQSGVAWAIFLQSKFIAAPPKEGLKPVRLFYRAYLANKRLKTDVFNLNRVKQVGAALGQFVRMLIESRNALGDVNEDWIDFLGELGPRGTRHSILSSIASLYVDAHNPGQYTNYADHKTDFDNLCINISTTLNYVGATGYFNQDFTYDQRSMLTPVLSQPGGEYAISELLSYNPNFIRGSLAGEWLGALIGSQLSTVAQNELLKRLTAKYVRRNSHHVQFQDSLSDQARRFFVSNAPSEESSKGFAWVQQILKETSPEIKVLPGTLHVQSLEWFKYFSKASLDPHSYIFRFFSENHLGCRELTGEAMRKYIDQLDEVQIEYARKSSSGLPLTFTCFKCLESISSWTFKWREELAFNVRDDRAANGDTILHHLGRNAGSIAENGGKLLKSMATTMPVRYLNLLNNDGKTFLDLYIENTEKLTRRRGKTAGIAPQRRVAFTALVRGRGAKTSSELAENEG